MFQWSQQIWIIWLYDMSFNDCNNFHWMNLIHQMNLQSEFHLSVYLHRSDCTCVVMELSACLLGSGWVPVPDVMLPQRGLRSGSWKLMGPATSSSAFCLLCETQICSECIPFNTGSDKPSHHLLVFVFCHSSLRRLFEVQSWSLSVLLSIAAWSISWVFDLHVYGLVRSDSNLLAYDNTFFPLVSLRVISWPFCVGWEYSCNTCGLHWYLPWTEQNVSEYPGIEIVLLFSIL